MSSQNIDHNTTSPEESSTIESETSWVSENVDSSPEREEISSTEEVKVRLNLISSGTEFEENGNERVTRETTTGSSTSKSAPVGNRYKFFSGLTRTLGDVRFLLHPSLSYTSSSRTCTIQSPPSAPKVDSKSRLEGRRDIIKRRRDSKLKICRSPISSGNGNTNTSSNEQLEFVSASADEILYQIASGKWNYSNMVFEEDDDDGTKTLGNGLKTCSNVDCVRDAENLRRKSRVLSFQEEGILAKDENIDNKDVIFEDGNLPSYHSLLNLWNRERYKWSRTVFKKGFPLNDNDFLKMWRECRKHPEAYGIKINLPSTNLEEDEGPYKIPPFRKGSPTVVVNKHPLTKHSKRPVRLDSREYWNSNWKPATNKQERELQKKRYEELRTLYPHLPKLRDIDYKVNTETVKFRMKQAEDWHRLVTVTSKPQPVIELSYLSKMNQDVNGNQMEDCPGGTIGPEKQKVPRYAKYTASSINKITARVNRFP
ncbi:unnamed protein product [Orchesella dallaii]|uniref:Uncharacterized protein n=1 Tax=Orchesella dallaii TaxID=48710 RepID=A0ABP1QRI4_9HEXA